jgi:hypothetical protein
MSEALNVGDRVRVCRANHPHGYPRGAKGTVLRVATRVTTGAPYYLVAMDGDGSDATGILFRADEIEPDV